MSLVIRPAQESDLDCMTDICTEAFPLDPQWNYRFPYRLQFPKDHYEYTRMYYADALADSTSHKVMVAKMEDLPGSVKSRVIALSLWRMPGVADLPNPQKCPCTNTLSSCPYCPESPGVLPESDLPCRCKPPRCQSKQSQSIHGQPQRD